MKPSKVRQRLAQSLDSGRIATAVRGAFEIAMTDGYVIALTNDWVVMHTLDAGIYLDEIVMLRIEDVAQVWFRDDDAYHRRATAALGESVASFDCNANASAADLIEAASAWADIFATHFEVLDGEPFFIGRLIKLRNKSFDMHYLGRDGVWAREVERWKYRDVTRIELGGRYLNALNRFADPYPHANSAEGPHPGSTA